MSRRSSTVVISREVFNVLAAFSKKVKVQAKIQQHRIEVPPFSVYKGGKLIRIGGCYE